MNRAAWTEAAETVALPALALAGALLLFGGFVWLGAHDPLQVWRLLFAGAFGDAFSWQNTLQRAAPLMLSALCVALPARAGLMLDLLRADERSLADLRGREISMIFQSPRTALNPIRPIGVQIEDVLRRHAAARGADLGKSLREHAVAALRDVAIADPERRHAAYPFELSGGMCQRVMIALALACRPSLLIADEPTTGLDVTTQAAVMDLITSLARERQMATLFITHDLALAADHCDRVVVMHAGHAVEAAPARQIFTQARHPYTARLLSSTPDDRTRSAQSLAPVPGNLPDLRRGDLPRCRFAERCERASDRCERERPVLEPDAVHSAACWHPLFGKPSRAFGAEFVDA